MECGPDHTRWVRSGVVFLMSLFLNLTLIRTVRTLPQRRGAFIMVVQLNALVDLLNNTVKSLIDQVCLKNSIPESILTVSLQRTQFTDTLVVADFTGILEPLLRQLPDPVYFFIMMLDGFSLRLSLLTLALPFIYRYVMVCWYV